MGWVEQLVASYMHDFPQDLSREGALTRAMRGGLILLAQVAWAYYEADFRMIGGKEADASEHPFLTFVFHRVVKLQCAGALVGPGAVVTAGHCIHSMRPLDYDVRANIYNVSRRATNPNCVYMKVTSLVLPAIYSRTKKTNDIGLILVKPSEDLPAFIKLDGRNLVNTGSTFQALGWGFTEPNGISSQVPTELGIKVIEDKKCQDDFGKEYFKLCAFCATGIRVNTTTCRGDSGGPVFTSDKKILVGIVSYGEKNCSTDSAVFTRIYYFEKWIRGKITPKVSYNADLTLPSEDLSHPTPQPTQQFNIQKFVPRPYQPTNTQQPAPPRYQPPPIRQPAYGNFGRYRGYVY
ncbi:Chymase [Entomophthora muscae]|uniref:Chymase n=1 Tax=Entomophthora muscae TaxID=34485 RepID=A0ACC2T4M3_9FUNG|nr:Chymase [Entomophthora muscae]